MPDFFLNSYRPLQATLGGRFAAAKHGIAAYVDASCRREPDFEARWPTITALCRGTKFAPRLHEQDRIAYITVKLSDSWKLVALLVIKKRLESHSAAAQWYLAHGKELPSNLMVADNRPRPLEHTYRCGPCSDRNAELRAWDEHYRERSEECGVVLVCDIEFLNLVDPPSITRDEWDEWYGRVPPTRAGLRIPEALWKKLERRARV